MVEVDTNRLIQLIGLKEVELTVLRERVRSLEVALKVATQKSEESPETSDGPAS